MMLKTREDLVAIVTGIDKDLAKRQARFERNIARFYANYKAQVEALVRRELDTGAELQLASVQQIANDMQRLLGEAGSDDLIGDYVDEFPELSRQALSYFKAMGVNPRLSGVSRTALGAYIRFTEETIRENFDRRLVKPLQETMFQSLFGNQPRQVVIDAVAAKMTSLSPIQVQTTVSDAFMQFQRQVTVEGAKELEMDIYLYVGPDDALTSEQCEHLLYIDEHGLPGALYEDEISADLHEKLRANPLIAGGHPRCRHKYSPLTLDLAKEMGFRP